MRKAVAFCLFLFCTTYAADLDYDYRSGGSQSPTQFEQSITLADMYPNSVTIFSRGYSASWALSSVDDFAADSRGLTAIRQQDLITLPDNACGGLLAHEEGSVQRSGDHLIVSSADTHTLYYIPDCGWYNRSPKEGSIIDFNDEYICEASPDGYAVKDAIGLTVYRGETTEPPLAAYSRNGKCYYIGNKGTLTQVDPKYGEMTTLFETAFAATAAQATDNGLLVMGDEASQYMFIRFEQDKAIYVDYYPQPASDCLLAIGSSEPFCADEYPELFAEAKDADKLAATAEGIYILQNEQLTAYEASEGWVKSFIPSAAMPYACKVANDYIYYLDLSGAMWQIDLQSQTVEKIVAFPKSPECQPVSFKDGAFFSANGKFLYQYAELIMQEGGRSLYKRDQGDVLYYFVTQ
ncbi:MAG: hypothetical protein LBV04_07770 [Deferribacteraceae bacterium]|jgi:hypothetical protein|nr:hypothetical protein [Deferribacteraceae bacterium]